MGENGREAGGGDFLDVLSGRKPLQTKVTFGISTELLAVFSVLAITIIILAFNKKK